MFAVVSLIEPEKNDQSRLLWDRLEQICGLSGIKLSLFPHFSWHVASGYQCDELVEHLQRIAGQNHTFRINISGLGLFTGEQPVLYLPIVRTAHLNNTHNNIWEISEKYSIHPSSFYSPERWSPHITLAHREATRQNILCGISDLINVPLSIELIVDNISVIYEENGQVGIRFKQQLTG